MVAPKVCVSAACCGSAAAAATQRRPTHPRGVCVCVRGREGASVVDLYLPMPWQGKRDWKPLEDRSCTDIPWLILFTLFCIGMVSDCQFCECRLLMDAAAGQWVHNPVLRRCQSFRGHCSEPKCIGTSQTLGIVHGKLPATIYYINN